MSWALKSVLYEVLQNVRWTTDYWTMFPVKCRVQDSILSYRLFRCHRFSPTPSHTHYLLLSLWRFSSMCWTDELNKKTLKHTRREICVDGGWLFFSDAGYTLTKKLSLNVFMCSFCCFVLTVKSSYSNNFSFFFDSKNYNSSVCHD